MREYPNPRRNYADHYAQHTLPYDLWQQFEDMTPWELQTGIKDAYWEDETLTLCTEWDDIFPDDTAESDPTLEACVILLLKEAAAQIEIPPPPITTARFVRCEEFGSERHTSYRGIPRLPEDLMGLFYRKAQKVFDGICDDVLSPEDEHVLLIALDCDEYAGFFSMVWLEEWLKPNQSDNPDRSYESTVAELLACLESAAAELDYPPTGIKEIVICDDGYANFRGLYI